ncbi:MAG TPA: dimethylamine monooxygenase subunit DmmA family protein [Pseudoneobacillus sp.]|nr:dimethylamine monooxygenase subunit DmmA family protein [Pseudoneobacillus sp.]
MKNQANFIQGKRKYLFLVDQIGIELLKPIIDHTIEKNNSFEAVFLGELIEGETEKTNIEQWLSKQKMGTYLYVALPWNKLLETKRLIEKIGFTEEEVQCIGYGHKQIHVFCCRCHGITTVTNGEDFIPCQYCQLELEITDHYSSLRDAYLGYVAKL